MKTTESSKESDSDSKKQKTRKYKNRMKQIIILGTMFMLGLSAGLLQDSGDYQPIPENAPVIASAYNSSNGDYVLEIGRLDKGYTVCIQEEGFEKVNSEDVFGGFECSHFPDQMHPVVEMTREGIDGGGNKSAE